MEKHRERHTEIRNVISLTNVQVAKGLLYPLDEKKVDGWFDPKCVQFSI